jgi:hypothetical protein
MGGDSYDILLLSNKNHKGAREDGWKKQGQRSYCAYSPTADYVGNFMCASQE